jgi:hypothetical protein
MKPNLLHVLQHSLGVDKFGQGTTYRNYFAAGALDEVVCRDLIALGFMQEYRSASPEPYVYFAVTDDGIRAMRRESPMPPNLTPTRRHYLECLRTTGDCSCSFAKCLKNRTSTACRGLAKVA